jgi:hypothetical protein
MTVTGRSVGRQCGTVAFGENYCATHKGATK